MTFVSVIVPCFNEEKTIGLLLDALCMQTYPLEKMEVVVADGLSTDGTRQAIADFQQAHPQLMVRVVENPARHIPAGLNAALRASRGEVIVRMDVHAVPARDHVARCVADLQGCKRETLGGHWEIEAGGQRWQARSSAESNPRPAAPVENC